MQGIRRFSLVLALTTIVAMAAFGQSTPSPVIMSIDPQTGPTSGGINVAITGTNLDLPPNFACILPCPTRVWFGGAEAIVRESSNTRVVVQTPQHDPGTVDVKLTTGDARTTTAPNGFTYAGGIESGYEMLLLPVYLDSDTPGANGSTWRSDFWMRNNSTLTLALAPWVCPEGTACPAIFPLTYSLKPGESYHNLPLVKRPAGAPPTRLLYVSRSARGSMSYQLRVADISRAALNGGTELPVVHESEFITTTTTLLNVPLDPRFRQTLRIYEMKDGGNTPVSSSFRVRIYGQENGTNGTLLAEKTVVATSTQSGSFRDQPAFGQIPYLAEGIFAFPESNASLRVEIEPLTAGSRYWAMVSVTNNDTQQITTVTPQ